jgi:flagellar protein FliL
MSTATATDAEAPAPKKSVGKKKLLIIVGAAVLVLGLAGGGAVIYLKKKAAAAAEAEENAAGEIDTKVAARDPKVVPTFVPLDPFTVNLADRDAERFAQVAVSLELRDPKTADQIKLFMPVIRNNILMVLSHKTSADMLGREGKAQLALEIQREASRALGVEISDAKGKPDAAAAKADPADDGDGDKPAAKQAKKKDPLQDLPVSAVHFSNFIVQ